MITNNYYRLTKYASKLSITGAQVTANACITLPDVKTKTNTNARLLTSYNSQNSTNATAGYVVFASYSQFFTVDSVEFSSTDNPNFQKTDYCLEDPITGINNIAISNNYIDTESGIENTITFTGHNNSGAEMTLKNFALYHNVKYMSTYYSGTTSDPVLIATGVLDNAITVPIDGNFSVTFKWIES